MFQQNETALDVARRKEYGEIMLIITSQPKVCVPAVLIFYLYLFTDTDKPVPCICIINYIWKQLLHNREHWLFI